MSFLTLGNLWWYIWVHIQLISLASKNILMILWIFLSVNLVKCNAEVWIKSSGVSFFLIYTIYQFLIAFFHPKFFQTWKYFDRWVRFDEIIGVPLISILHVPWSVFVLPWSKFFKSVNDAAWYWFENFILVCVTFVDI